MTYHRAIREQKHLKEKKDHRNTEMPEYKKNF